MYFLAGLLASWSLIFVSLANPRTLVYNLYSYLDYLFIYLSSRQFLLMILIGEQLLLHWSIQGLPCQTLPFCNILYFNKCNGNYLFLVCFYFAQIASPPLPTMWFQASRFSMNPYWLVMYLKEQASLRVPPMNEKYTIYQVLIVGHKFIKDIYFLAIFITLTSLFRCTNI